MHEINCIVNTAIIHCVFVARHFSGLWNELLKKSKIHLGFFWQININSNTISLSPNGHIKCIFGVKWHIKFWNQKQKKRVRKMEWNSLRHDNNEFITFTNLKTVSISTFVIGIKDTHTHTQIDVINDRIILNILATLIPFPKKRGENKTIQAFIYPISSHCDFDKYIKIPLQFVEREKKKVIIVMFTHPFCSKMFIFGCAILTNEPLKKCVYNIHCWDENFGIWFNYIWCTNAVHI